MRTSLLYLVLGALAVTFATTSPAHAQLDTRDRLLLFYNYYQNQQNSRQILENQQTLRSNVRQFQQSQFQRQTTVDPIERYIRGAAPLETERRPLPRIYSGSGGRTQYFMRMEQFGTQFPASGRR